MKLNEDYFDNLEIEDEDITVDDELVNEPQTIEEHFDYYKQHYSSTIELMFDYKMAYESQEYVSDPNVMYLIDKIQELLDVYCIEYSEALIVQPQTDKDEYEITDMFAYKQIKNPDVKFDYSQSVLEIYVNFPKFTWKQAVSFVIRLQNIVWNRKFEDMIYSINLLDKILTLPIICHRRYDACGIKYAAFYKACYTNNVTIEKISKGYSYNNLFKIIKWFFGPSDAITVEDRVCRNKNPFTGEQIKTF